MIYESILFRLTVECIIFHIPNATGHSVSSTNVNVKAILQILHPKVIFSFISAEKTRMTNLSARMMTKNWALYVHSKLQTRLCMSTISSVHDSRRVVI